MAIIRIKASVFEQYDNLLNKLAIHGNLKKIVLNSNCDNGPAYDLYINIHGYAYKEHIIMRIYLNNRSGAVISVPESYMASDGLQDYDDVYYWIGDVYSLGEYGYILSGNDHRRIMAVPN